MLSKISMIDGSKSRVVTIGIIAVILPPYLATIHKVERYSPNKFLKLK